MTGCQFLYALAGETSRLLGPISIACDDARSRRLGIEQIAQAVTEEIEPQDCQGNRPTREYGEPRIHRQEALGLAEHESPGRMRRLRPEPEIGQAGLGEDRDGKARGRLHDE